MYYLIKNFQWIKNLYFFIGKPIKKITDRPVSIIACSFLLLFIFPQLKAQVTSAIPSPPIHAPQAADLGKVVFSPVSLYTGQPNISVPVYNVTNRNLEIPISLNYDASGFVPNKAPSPVGLNWSMVTGVITRTVNMFPDEMTENLGNTSSGPGVISKGFFHRTASHTNAGQRTRGTKNRDLL